MAEQTLSSFIDKVLESSCILCAICKDLLKLPIMLIENIGNACSTCYEEQEGLLKNKKISYNTGLEDILKMMTLPCKFKTTGCEERVMYEDLIFHQNNCKYRTKLCSLFENTGCEWEGSTVNFVEHFRKTHGDHIINFDNNFFYLQSSLTELNLIKLLVMKNKTFILHMQTNLTKNKLFYFICHVTDNNLTCEYSVKHKGNSDNYIKTKAKILPDYNFYKDFDENIAVQVDLDALKQITDISDTITNIFKIKIKDMQAEGIDEKMLHFLECPVCLHFMKPPIYQCQSGHSMCNMCRHRLEKCPTCRSTFGTTRNYSLEHLTSGVHYLCMYHDLGCTEISLASQIATHENECPFKSYNCPFTHCTYTGNQQAILAHLKHFHFEGVILSGTSSYTESLYLDRGPCLIQVLYTKYVVAYKHIFRFACSRCGNVYVWMVRVFGAHDRSKKFIYEVTIVDMRRPERKLINTDHCSEEISWDRPFKYCIVLPYSVLSSYSINGSLTFHFTIKEK